MHRRARGGLSQPRRAAVDAAGPAPRPRPALAGAGAGRLARRDQRRRPAHAHLAEHRRGARRRGAQGCARHAPPPVRGRAPDDPVPRRRRDRQRRGPGPRGGRDRGLPRRRRARARAPGRAPRGRAGSLADPAGGHRGRRLRGGTVRRTLGTGQGRRDAVPRPDADPGRPAEPRRPEPAGYAAQRPPRDAASRGGGRAVAGDRRRRAGRRRVRPRREGAVRDGDRNACDGPGPAERRAVQAGSGHRRGHRPRRQRPGARRGAPDPGVHRDRRRGASGHPRDDGRTGAHARSSAPSTGCTG